MRLQRVVEDGLCAVLGLDDDVGLGEAALDVAALVAARLLEGLPCGDGVVGVEVRAELLPFDLHELERRGRLRVGVGRDGCDGCALEAGLAHEDVALVGADRVAHAGGRQGRGQVELPHARVRVRAAEHGRVEHPGKPDVGRVLDLAAGARVTVDPCRRASDHLHGALGPAVERILLDDDPLLRVLAFDLLLGADQSRHVEIASSIFGYAPQRQRLPDMAWRISSRLGAGVSPTSAEAETIWPGVQNPH